jgi:N-methylhydantoinase A
VVPPAPGLFSAFGLLAADVTHVSVRSIVSPEGEPLAAWIESLFGDAEEHGRDGLRSQGVAEDAVCLVREIDARYAGQSFELTMPARTPFDEAAREALSVAFHDRHERVYGYASRDERVELVNVRSTAVGAVPKPVLRRAETAAKREPATEACVGERDVYVVGRGRVATPVYDRGALVAGDGFAGPAVVEQFDATTFVAPGWSADVDAYANLVLAR